MLRRRRGSIFGAAGKHQQTRGCTAQQRGLRSRGRLPVLVCRRGNARRRGERGGVERGRGSRARHPLDAAGQRDWGPRQALRHGSCRLRQLHGVTAILISPPNLLCADNAQPPSHELCWHDRRTACGCRKCRSEGAIDGRGRSLGRGARNLWSPHLTSRHSLCQSGRGKSDGDSSSWLSGDMASGGMRLAMTCDGGGGQVGLGWTRPRSAGVRSGSRPGGSGAP